MTAAAAATRPGWRPRKTPLRSPPCSSRPLGLSPAGALSTAEGTERRRMEAEAEMAQRAADERSAADGCAEGAPMAAAAMTMAAASGEVATEMTGGMGGFPPSLRPSDAASTS